MNRWKRWLTILIVTSLLCGCSSDWSDLNVRVKNSKKVYAIWFSYLDFHTLTEGKTLENYTESVDKILSNCESLGINTIYLQVSAFTDAMYDSQYYPTSTYASGKLGKAIDYDPLEVIIQQAENYNIEIHAWINPFRSFTTKEMASLSKTYTIRKWSLDALVKNHHLMVVKDRYYLNPGAKEARELVLRVVEELCTNYKIAGIHIDDYFYPNGIDDEDAETYQEYLEEHPEASVEEYRKDVVNTFVRDMYQTVKAVNDQLTVSISPAGNIKNNEAIYADVKTWVTNSGYCDVIIPQIYFGFENSVCPFEETVNQWHTMASTKVSIIYGLAAYKVGEEDTYAKEGIDEWINNVDMLSRQVEYISSLSRYHGFALYRYESIFHPKESIKQQMKLEISKLKPYLQ